MQIDLELFTHFSDEAEKTFRIAIDSMEKNFRENVYMIKELFYHKIESFKEFNEAIQANHEMISKQYELTQKKLKTKLDKI